MKMANKKGETDSSRDKNEHIEVFVRVRPLNANERKQFSPSVVEIGPDKKSLNVKEKVNDKILNKSYAFHRVFGQDCTQVDVYKTVVLPLIREVFMGYNCTIFAYGQTSTGKTYTMEGERSNSSCSWEKDPSAGIIPRALHQLFEELNSANVEFTVLVSFLELYNEELFDLLSASDDIPKLKLYEDATRKGSVVIQGLEEVAVNSKGEVYSILSKGTARRQTAATLMNATSSRSHTVFSVTVHMKEITLDGEELLKTGKLNLVDLAGSENIGRSGAVDKRAREAGSINQSLLTLGRVITALVEKAPHIPYRESKLTRLLQDSLGGHTKTSIIATISPAQCNIDETLSTLEYACRAKNITNRPEVNQKMTRQALIKEYTEEIERLRRDLMATKEKRGICIGEEVYATLQNEMAFKSEEIKEMQAQMDILKEQLEKVNMLFQDTRKELDDRSEELDLQEKLLDETSQKLASTREELGYTGKAFDKASLERDENQYLVTAHIKTEKELGSQAQKILGTVDATVSDISALHAKLDRKASVQTANNERSTNLRYAFDEEIDKLDEIVANAVHEHSDYLKDLDNSVAALGNKLQEQSRMAFSQFENFVDSQNKHLASFSSQLAEKNDRQSLPSMMKNKEASQINHSLRSICSMMFGELENIMKVQTSLINAMKTEVSLKVEENVDMLKSYRADQKEIIDQLHNEVNSFTQKKEKELELCEQYASNVLCKSTSHMTKFEEKLNSLDGLVSELREFGENCKAEVASDLSQVKEVLDVVGEEDCSHGKVKRYCEDMDSSVKQLESLYIDGLSKIKSDNEGNVQKSLELFRSAESCTDSIKCKVLETVEENGKVWEQSVHDTELMLNHHTEQVLGNICNNVVSIQKLGIALEEQGTIQKTTLGSHLEEFQKEVLPQQKLISRFDENLVNFTKELSKEIQQTDGILEKFISEDLLHDIPTGYTPEKKEYDYPCDLVATSPYDRLCQRFRETISGDQPHFELPLDMELDIEEKTRSSAESQSDGMDVLNVSFSSDDSCMSAKSVDSVSSKNESNAGKGSRKENKKNSKRPNQTSQKVSKMRTVRPTPVSRRPFTPSNS